MTENFGTDAERIIEKLQIEMSEQAEHIRQLEKELAANVPYLRKLAEYQAAHIDQAHTH